MTVETQTESCISCGASQALLHPRLNQFFCPQCTHDDALFDAAKHHLHAILEQPIRAWSTHWQEAGLETDALRDLIQDLDGNVLALQQGIELNL